MNKNFIKLSIYALVLMVMNLVFVSTGIKSIVCFSTAVLVCYIFTDNFREKSKYKKAINVVAIFLKLTITFFGALFIHYATGFGDVRLQIGVIFIILGILSSRKLSTSIMGLTLLNVVAYYFLGRIYYSFCTGIVVFLAVEFISGTPMQLLAPFNKSYYKFTFSGLNVTNKVMVGAISAFLVALTIVGTYATKPFGEGYARTKNNDETKVERRTSLDKTKKIQQPQEQNNKKK